MAVSVPVRRRPVDDPAVYLQPEPSGPMLPDGWPLLAVLFGFGIWWVLGLSNFIWIIAAGPMLAAMLMQRHTPLPRGAIVPLAFLALAGVSFLQVETASQQLTWLYRWGVQAAAVVALLYGYSRPTSRLATSTVVSGLAAYWFVIVIGGLLALVAPTLQFESALEVVLPAGLLVDPYTRSLVDPQIVQVHDFLGFPVNRPAAPFIYTNQWGSSLALTTPFLILWAQQGGPRRRIVAMVAAGVALIPVVQSLNRGLWLTLAIGLIYAAVRLALRGDARALAAVLVGMIAVVVILLVTPLGDLIALRAETGHSDEGRLTLYVESIEYARQRPLTGFGGPVFDPENTPYAPPVGTHGHLWFVLVSYGVPAMIVMLATLAWVMARTRRAAAGTMAFWTNVVFVIAAAQTLVYSLIPSQWPVLLAAAGIALREVDRPALERHRR